MSGGSLGGGSVGSFLGGLAGSGVSGSSLLGSGLGGSFGSGGLAGGFLSSGLTGGFLFSSPSGFLLGSLSRLFLGLAGLFNLDFLESGVLCGDFCRQGVSLGAKRSDLFIIVLGFRSLLGEGGVKRGLLLLEVVLFLTELILGILEIYLELVDLRNAGLVLA